MFNTLPAQIQEFMSWSWEQIEFYYVDLVERPLVPATVESWLEDWSKIDRLIRERLARLYVNTSLDTTDGEAETALNSFLDDVYAHVQKENNQLQKMLLDSQLTPAGMEIPLRDMRSEAALFREANIPLFSKEIKEGADYDKIIGAQVVEWEGEELTLTQLIPHLQTLDRAVRESGWRLASERQLQDREALNALWTKLLYLRREIGENAGYDDYRAFRWQQMQRFDYTHQDAATFHDAIESVVVPAANRVYARYKERLGVDTLRPWDVEASYLLYNLPAIKPYDTLQELKQTSSAIFHKVDPVLGGYFDTMRQDQLLSLPNRKGKAPGAYCTYYPTSERPFIFMNAVGTGDDIRTMLHEAGHAFHVFESVPLPYSPQQEYPMEFAEVASMSMELLAFPYVTRDQNGFFTSDEAARWRTAHLEKIILFWPYMAIVDGFQHWAYTHANQAADAANCDTKWRELWQRFIPAIDFSGFEDVRDTGWHRKPHIFRSSFYYIEYGMAQLGALQVWRNALKDQATAVHNYRTALALGATRSLPDLFSAAGARFAFDKSMMTEMVDLIESQIAVMN